VLCSVVYCSVVYCSCSCSWNCYKTFTFCSLLTRCKIPCACHAKPHLNRQKWSVHLALCTFWIGNVLRATTACNFFRHLHVKKWFEHVVFLTFWLGKPQQRAIFRHLNFQKWSGTVSFWHFWLGDVLRATPACTFSTSQVPKVLRRWCVLCMTWKCASLRRLNYQKWSEHGVLCLFLLGNVLRATTAYTFSTSRLLELLRSWGALRILTWKCASRYNGVQLFISHLARWLRIPPL
jgi:hypothetical protein